MHSPVPTAPAEVNPRPTPETAARHGKSTAPFVVGVLEGEGIGPEVIGVTLEVLDVLEQWQPGTFEVRKGGKIGKEAERLTGRSLTDEVIGFCEDIFAARGAVLCGPGGGRFVYDLRRQFDLYTKLIPLRPWPVLRDAGPLRPERVEGVDIIVVRENASGFYFGPWGEVDRAGTTDAGRSAYQQCTYTESEVERILRVGLDLARRRGRRLTVVAKPGGIPTISRLWADKLEELNARADVEARVMEVDNAAFQLIACPRDFDVVVCPNMFGDIIGDCGSLLLGSRGLSFSGNFGPPARAVYQTGHGAAWDLARTDRANPIGQISSLVMMLRDSFGLHSAADLVEYAVQNVLAGGIRTADIAGPTSRIVGTREMGRRICEALADLPADAT